MICQKKKKKKSDQLSTALNVYLKGLVSWRRVTHRSPDPGYLIVAKTLLTVNVCRMKKKKKKKKKKEKKRKKNGKVTTRLTGTADSSEFKST